MGENDTGVLLLDECFFDHNGWLGYNTTRNYRDHINGQATLLNHNTYFTSARNVLMRGNIFSRPSSIQNKFTGSVSSPAANIRVVDNLYIEGELGISAGGNSEGMDRFQNLIITDNVFTHVGRDNPTQRTLAWYIELTDWLGGEVSGNLLLHQLRSDIVNTYGINLRKSIEI